MKRKPVSAGTKRAPKFRSEADHTLNPSASRAALRTAFACLIASFRSRAVAS